MRANSAVLALAVVLLIPVSCRAQGGFLEALEDLFDNKQAQPAQNDPFQGEAILMVDDLVIPGMKNGKVGRDFVNMYTPFVTKVMTAELHFLKKVCEPTDEQFDKFHETGLLAVALTCKHYEDLQKIRQAASEWPQPQERITAALARAVDQSMSAEVAQRYRDELKARQEAHRAASAGMMLVHIDQQLMLAPDQYQAIREALEKDWNSGWSTGIRLFMYPQYARMPESHVLRPHLTDRQRKLWSARPNHGTVNFGWQMELGMQDFFGAGVELQAFEKKPIRKLKPAPQEADVGEGPEPEETSAVGTRSIFPQSWKGPCRLS